MLTCYESELRARARAHRAARRALAGLLGVCGALAIVALVGAHERAREAAVSARAVQVCGDSPTAAELNSAASLAVLINLDEDQ